MKAVLQRVIFSKVTVEEQIVAEIDKGILALIGIENSDNKTTVEKLIQKILRYRIFGDAKDKMNLSVMDISGGLLLVPQFTIVSNTNKGLRPDFNSAGSAKQSKELFEYLTNFAKKNYQNIQTGVFGANMAIELCNDGPVTFILEN